MWFHIIFELDQAKPSVLDQDYLKYSNNAVVTGKLISINFLEFFISNHAIVDDMIDDTVFMVFYDGQIFESFDLNIKSNILLGLQIPFTPSHNKIT